MERTKSPKPDKAKKSQPAKVDFIEALKQVLAGKSITKAEWENRKYYGLLKDTRLQLHKPDGKFYDWILSEGDMTGEDWEII